MEISTGIIMIITGLLCILLQKTQGFKDYIEKHNYTEEELFFSLVRNMIGGILIGFGVIILLYRLLIAIS